MYKLKMNKRPIMQYVQDFSSDLECEKQNHRNTLRANMKSIWAKKNVHKLSPKNSVLYYKRTSVEFLLQVRDATFNYDQAPTICCMQ